MGSSVKHAHASSTALQANESQGLRGQKDRALTTDVTTTPVCQMVVYAGLVLSKDVMRQEEPGEH